VLLTYFALDETVTTEQRAANRHAKRVGLSPADIGRNYLLLLMLGIGFVGQFGVGMLQSTFALYGEAVLFKGYSEASTNLGIGLLLATVGVGQFTTQTVLLPRLVKPLGEARLVVAGSLLRALGLFFFAVIASPWMGGISSLVFAVGAGLMMPPLQSLATQTVADELRGGVLGVFQSVVSLAIILSTAIAGSIFAINPIAPYWIGGVLNVAIVLPGLILVGQSRAGKLDLAGIGR
jgi:DHA1 family tetracycline resistance protein-like MFS transporter